MANKFFLNNSLSNESSEERTTDVGFPSDMYPILAIIYLFVFVAGVVGNCLVIIVIATDRRMKNVSNFFLVSLSLADLMIILFCLPVAVWDAFASEWIFGNVLCKLIPYLQHLSVNASILTMLSISFERLFVIYVPLKARSYCTKRRAVVVIIVIWAICAVSSLPAIFLGRIVTKNQDAEENGEEFAERLDDTSVATDNSSTLCWNQIEGFEWYIVTEVIAFYAFPGCVLFCVYFFIIRTLRRCCATQAIAATPAGDRRVAVRRRKSRSQLILMLATVVVTYFVCLLPFNTVIMMFATKSGLLLQIEMDQYEILLSVSRLLFFINSCVNPILYNAISTKFRSAFIRLFVCSWKKNRSDYSNVYGFNSHTQL